MKLTAPPPGSESEPELPPDVPPTEAPTPETPAPAIPYQKPPERIATWPTWFGPGDIVLAVLTLALVFLASSFAARNSDVWLHLASGKRLTTGEYKLGTDPFSYTAADRTWVNHNWLFDLGAYLLYSDDGMLLVVLKALTVVAAFGLLIAIRRPGQPILPWAILAILAILASASMFTLRPYVASVLFLAFTLFLVFRMPTNPGSWRLPLAIGGTFTLWSNFDAWFLLGPATLLLLTVGEAIRSKLLKQDSASLSDPIGALPDLGTLLKALAVGVLACMLNPHHVGVWELPFELAGPNGAMGDPRIRAFFFAPAKRFPFFFEDAFLGQNVSGLAYVALLLLGLYAAFLSAVLGRFFGSAAEVEPLPVPHMLLWVAFAALSAMTMFAIPFFAMVTIPLVASRFNLFSSHVRLGTWSDRGSRMLLMGSSAGRLASLFAVLLLCVAAWPGWLHAPASCWWETGLGHPANTRRVEWKVEADPDMKASAEWLDGVKSRGSLPENMHGFVASIDLANYCAWFAPKEKVFANGRLSFHRPELPEFAKARRGLGAFVEKAELPDPRETEEVLKKWKASYVAIAWQRSDTELNRLLMEDLKSSMWLVIDHWTPWFFTGRSAISGWRETGAASDPVFRRLELNAEAAAYGPEVERLPTVKAEPPIVQQSLWDELFVARKPTPTGVEEALSWLRFKSRASLRNQMTQQSAALLRLNQPGIASPNFAQALFQARDEILARNLQLRLPPPADGSYRTYPILALRAARRAIAENPDHPDGYFALAQVLSDRDLPIGDGERSVALVTAYQMCLARLPKPAEFKRNFFVASPSQVSKRLAMIYVSQFLETGDFLGHRIDMGILGELGGGGVVYRIPAGPATGGKVAYARLPVAAAPQLPEGSAPFAPGLYILPLDLAQQLLASSEDYVKVEIENADARNEELKELGQFRKALDASYRKTLDQFRRASEKATRLRDRHALAMQFGLVGEALKMLAEADIAKEFGQEATGIVFHMISLQLAIGRLEEGAANLASLRNEIQLLAEKPGISKESIKLYQRWLSELEFQKLILEGNYAEAGKEYESLEGKQVGLKPVLDEIAQAKVDPANYKDFEKIAPHLGTVGVAWPIFPMFGISPVSTGEPLQVLSAYWLGRVYVQHFQNLANARGAIMQRMERDAEFYYRRGVLALFEGDIAGAAARFRSTNQTPPKGWSVPEIRHVGAVNFLRQIQEAAAYKQP